MGLLDIVRSGVAIANSLTADLQANVLHRAALGLPDGEGTVPLGPEVSRPAIVIRKQKLVRTSTGQQIISTASVVFLDPAVVVNELDEITLPDGTTAPIRATEGFVDRGTGHPILTEAFLGEAL